MNSFFVYMLSNTNRGIYIGVTNNLERRLYEHKHGLVEGFTKKYRMHRLVHYEVTSDIRSAITREKRLKWWPRAWKVKLIESMNPNWNDLAADWSSL
ncbi:GIY-YIG nuclease family protein [candidate division KSB1 bacterium]|nr:GIY-YIG nuclease family protein [candidate division KSB1 bacterium]